MGPSNIFESVLHYLLQKDMLIIEIEIEWVLWLIADFISQASKLKIFFEKWVIDLNE